MTIKESILILAVFISGCATQSPVATPSAAVFIETKAQFKDLRSGETHNAKIEIVLSNQQAIRLEISALFGFPIASIVMSPHAIQYALHMSKEFVQGPFAAKTLQPVFKQNIDPRILWNVVHNRVPDSAELKCAKDNLQRPTKCMGPAGLQVTWAYDASDRDQKRIEIKNAQFEMIWVFKSRRPFTVVQNETFVLKKPEGYQQIQLK